MSGQNGKVKTVGSANKSSSSPATHSRPYFTYKPNINALKKGESEVKVNIKSGDVGRVHKSMINWTYKEE